MSIEDWATAALQGPYRQSRDQQLAIHTLEDVFYGKTGADLAATTIASLFDPLLQHGFTVSPVFELWVSVCEAVRMLGGNQDIDGRLIELLDAIAQLPDVKDQSGRAIGPGGGFSGIHWKDLPGLAITFREHAIGTLPISNPSFTYAIFRVVCLSEADIEPETPEMPDEGDWTEAQRATLMNVVTFGALYLVRGESNIDMSFHAEVSIMHGIESP